ncbi:acyl carrier protein [Oscillibacter ruminantium]|jgi:acyl carrier protein|uniref:acyl carrier protein n=1 Tax=Oscillibacter ruminantium TaxID=1263547 RepID=UPI0002FF44D3|nr:acyl carrier protein [Oscillibacter ruminantium]MDN0032910.1 acyl carrier protein [Oscillibacter valericigenes]MEA5042711.1 acyl carrier protein [Oscillibacter ruminantium]
MDFEKVRDVIVETLACEAEQVTMEASLADDLGADSLASVELVMALEEATGVAIDDAELPNLKTVGDIVKYLEDHKA